MAAPCPSLQPLGGRQEELSLPPRVGSGMQKAQGAASTALPPLRKRKCGLPLTSVWLLSARDSHHCHIQGTLCSRVVWMLIKLIPAFMCLADKAGWQCSKFRLVGSYLRRQTQTEPRWRFLWQYLHSQNGISPWQMGWINSAGQPCEGQQWGFMSVVSTGQTLNPMVDCVDCVHKREAQEKALF